MLALEQLLLFVHKRDVTLQGEHVGCLFATNSTLVRLAFAVVTLQVLAQAASVF